jgi:ribose transport system permease protein
MSAVLGAEKPGARTGLNNSFVQKLLRRPELFSFFGLAFLALLMTFLSDRFLTSENLSNIARQVSINAIISVGMTCVILTGGIDLSVGAVMALTGTVVAGLMLHGVSIVAAISLGLVVGILIGAINGTLISYAKLPPIIVTLAMMEIPRGIALLYTNGYPLSGLPEAYAFIGRGSMLNIFTPIVIMMGVYVLAYLVLSKWPTGRYILAIGGNEEAARLSGIQVKRNKLLVYVICGFTAAVSGVIMSSRLMSGEPNSGVGFELDAIAAVVLGGTDIAGGRGHIIGTLIGAVMLGVLNNGLNLMGVSPFLQRIIKGIIIIAAILVSSTRNRKKN